MKRAAILVLAVLLLAAALSSCGKKAPKEAPEGWITVTPEQDESIAEAIDEAHESLLNGN